MRIVFMGTPDFAVPSLAALVEQGFNIVAVVTTPDKPAGRGLKMRESAVKKYAVAQGIPVLQPLKLKNPEFIEALKALNTDLQVVVAFRMLPEIVWAMPPKGTINLHASLLPQYRGAAPINWAIINGETETGVTTFKLRHEIDTGQLIEQQKVPIEPDETAGELHDKLMKAGARLLLNSVNQIQNSTADYKPQRVSEEEPLHGAPKLFRADCKIDWNKDLRSVYNLIRGLSPYPGAWTIVNGQTMKILRAEKEETSGIDAPDNVLTDHQSYLKIACGDGLIVVKEIQPAGKKRMKVEDFLRGYRGTLAID